MTSRSLRGGHRPSHSSRKRSRRDIGAARYRVGFGSRSEREPTAMRTTRTLAATLVGGVLLLAPTACSDEDGDGATTGEELQDLEDDAEQLGDEVQEEIDGQDEGTNEDGE
jgi:hypothetical protein